MKHIFSAAAIGCIFFAPVVILNCNEGGNVMADEYMNKNDQNESDSVAADLAFTIKVSFNGNTVVFKLNTSPAAKDLYLQLPLSIPVENYSTNEKIFHPPERLSTVTTPLVDSARTGTLAYYAPWGNVVMFYGRFGSAPGLFALGHALSGTEHIQKMAGTIQIKKGIAK